MKDSFCALIATWLNTLRKMVLQYGCEVNLSCNETCHMDSVGLIQFNSIQ